MRFDRLLRSVRTLRAMALNSKPKPPFLNRHSRAPDPPGNLIVGHRSEQPVLLGSPTGQDRVRFGPAQFPALNLHGEQGMTGEGCHFFIWLSAQQLKLLRHPGPKCTEARDSQLAPPPSDVL